MALLTPAQISQYAQGAGFRGQGLNTAIAVALAESGGNTLAYNPETAAGTPVGSGSRGLWQIYGKAHPQYNSDAAYEPTNNARAAFAISGSGTNFQPWSTYTNGDYRKYLSQASGPSTTVTSDVRKLVPWVTYARVDNLGGIEPFGGFPKPDSNIQIPANFPVQALLPGTVTALDGGEVDWGAVVTIRLDTPINAMATHSAYLHLARSTVRVGQHVNTGDLIAYNGFQAAAGRQKVPLGFALYNGPHYGQGSAWSLMTKANLNGLLNPVPLLNSAKNGTFVAPAAGGGLLSSPVTGSGGGIPTYVPSSQQVHETLINTPGFYGIALALDEAEQFVGWVDLTRPQTHLSIAGVDTGVAPPDIVGLARSIGVTATDNFIAFSIRSSITALGVLLLLALMIKPISGALQTAAPFVAAGV